MKKFLLNGVICATGLLIVLELFFRCVLPASEWPWVVNAKSGVTKYENNINSCGYYSYGRYCQGHFFWRINNQGWNSIFDYKEECERNIPMIAILGDSFVEGFYSNVDEHIDVYLSEMFHDSIYFYSYAISGGYISQYIAMMRYEIEQYVPDAYLIFVNSSDVVKSFSYLGGRHPCYFQYTVDPLGNYTGEDIVLVDRSRSKYKDLILRSAFVRYLRANAQVSLFGAGLADENANQDEPQESEPVETGISPGLASAAEFLLSELNSFDRPVLIVADCPKSWIYETGAEEAFDDVIALRESVDSFPNVYLLELAGYYRAEYAEQNRSFSVSTSNSHWGSYANYFVAKTLVPSILALISTDSESEF